MAYTNTAKKAANNNNQQAAAAPQQTETAAASGDSKKVPTFHVVLADAEGELVSWEQIGASSTMISTEVKKFGDQKNASIGAIWMAESGKSGFLRIGDLTFKVFPTKRD